MILRKTMSLLGIGSAKIDLILPKEMYRPGEPIYGYFLVNGGIVEQKIKRIDCDLIMVDQTTGLEKIMDSVTILSSTLISSEELNKIPFVFKVPTSVQASTEEITYHFKTQLTFDKGVESKDQDMIQII